MRPIVIPSTVSVFHHPHVEHTLKLIDKADTTSHGYYCTTYRPLFEPGVAYVRNYTPCGLVLDWEQPDKRNPVAGA